MPKSTRTHKSMLLRGVKFAEPALNRSDIEVTKGRASRSGRSHGGAPLQGNGRGQNSFNYSGSNQNHHPPSHRQPYGSQNDHYSNYPVPPPGWQPPPPGVGGFARGPPPPPPGSYGYAGRGPPGYPQPPRQGGPPGYGPPSSGGYGDRRQGGGDGYGYGRSR